MASVLIVEDEPIAAWNIREALEDLGYQVADEASSGQAAIDLAHQLHPDLVLMDIRLNGLLDGIEAAACIQAELSIPVVFLTAHTDEKTLARAIATSPFGYVVKPFRRRELQTSIEIALHRHRQEKSLESAESHLVTTLESLGDGTVTTDAEGLVNFINPVAEALSGWSRYEILGQPVERLLPLRDVQTQQPLEDHPLHRALQSAIGQSLSQDCMLLTRQQQLRYISASASAIRDQQGRLLGAVLIFRDISERKQLEQRLRQQAEQERILNNIALAIRQSLDLETVLATTTHEVRQLLQVNRVIIYRMATDGHGQVIAESLQGSHASIQGRVVVDGCLAATPSLEKFGKGYVQVLADVGATELMPCYASLLAEFGIKANLVVPILIGETQIWGLLTAQHCDGPRLWQGWEVALMKQLALQVGIAIQQSQLYEQSRRQAQQEALLNEIVQTIRTSLNLEQVLHQTTASLLSAFQVSHCIARLGRDTDEAFIYSVSTTAPGVPPIADETMPIAHNPLVQQAFASDKAVAVADVAVPWLKILQPYCQRTGTRAILSIAIRYEGKVRGLLCLQQCDRTRLWSDDEQHLIAQVANQLAITIQQVELYRKLQRANQELKRLAHLDGLTQVANRRFFDEYLETEYRRQRRHGSPLALILCDVDHFKQFNDTYGHLAGDDCLRAIAQTIFKVLKRPGDLVARYGGEEFALVLPDTDLKGATTLADGVLTAVRQLRLVTSNLAGPASITVSMGIATVESVSDASPDALILAADQALYLAKAQGRDRYCGPMPLAVVGSPEEGTGELDF